MLSHIMLNQKSLDAVAVSNFKNQFCKPLYSSYCFSRIPATIKSLLLNESFERLPQDTTKEGTYNHVILLFIDGFGWQFFQHYVQKYPFLKQFLENGIASKLTSQFPSTTAAHVTCINTGLSTGESGVYEWFYYEPKLDRVIAPLLFSFAGEKQLYTLKKAGVKPEDLYPTRTIYQDLQEQGIHSRVIQHESIIDSPYSRVMFKGAQSLSYLYFQEALKKLNDQREQDQDKKCYYYLYFGDIDSAGHRHGIFSEAFEKEVDHCFRTLQTLLEQKTSVKTACILVADHGMTEIHPKSTRYLNLEIPECIQWFKTTKKGVPIVPAGSCRDFFLHIQPEYLDTAKKRLQEHFKGIAEIVLTQDLIAEKMFCENEPSEAFLERVGNLVILPFGNESIWWYEKHRFEQHFYAMHGGLTRPEMEIPFLFTEL